MQSEVKGPARVGETIKVVNETDPGWRRQSYPLGSTWIVKEVIFESSGLVLCRGNKFGICAKDYVVLKKIHLD